MEHAKTLECWCVRSPLDEPYPTLRSITRIAVRYAIQEPTPFNKACALRNIGRLRYERCGDDSLVWKAHDRIVAAADAAMGIAS